MFVGWSDKTSNLKTHFVLWGNVMDIFHCFVRIDNLTKMINRLIENINGSPIVYTVVHAYRTRTQNNTFCTYLTRFLKPLSVSAVNYINLKEKK